MEQNRKEATVLRYSFANLRLQKIAACSNSVTQQCYSNVIATI